MISWDQAHAIAADRVARLRVSGDDRAVLVDDLALTYDFGWLFEYQSERFLQTGDVDCRLLDNHAFLVHRLDGHVVELPRWRRDDQLRALAEAWAAGAPPPA